MSSSVFYSLCFCDKSFYDCDPNKKASVKLHKRKQETNDPRLKAKGNRAEFSFGFLCVFAWMQPRKRPSDFARSLSSTDSCLPVSYLASTWRDRRELPPRDRIQTATFLVSFLSPPFRAWNRLTPLASSIQSSTKM